MTVFKIIHEQSLLTDEADQVIEVRPWTRLELGYEAIQRGWLKRFQPNWIDLPILLAIALHARPLVGDDLDLLIQLGLASPSDAGRLYARLTDVGVSKILGCSRAWVNRASIRLADRKLLRIVQLPGQFRDSRGAYAGNNAYLLSGEVLMAANHRVNSVYMADFHHVNSVYTVGSHGANSVDTKNITLSSTLSNESGANRAPADFDVSGETDPVLDGEHATDESTLAASGNGHGAHHAGTETGSVADQRAYRLLQASRARLDQALDEIKALTAFQGLLDDLEVKFGFAEAGFRAARLSFEPLPDRRRRVLEDLRRMQGRADLKSAQRKRNLIGILTQNIGVTLGLGLLPDGHLRVLADKADYTVIGGLIDEYGAESVWLAACEMAGRAFEGDPITYLRAILRNKRERERGPGQTGAGSPPRVAAGMGRFEQLDYLAEEVGVEDT